MILFSVNKLKQNSSFIVYCDWPVFETFNHGLTFIKSCELTA